MTRDWEFDSLQAVNHLYWKGCKCFHHTVRLLGVRHFLWASFVDLTVVTIVGLLLNFFLCCAVRLFAEFTEVNNLAALFSLVCWLWVRWMKTNPVGRLWATGLLNADKRPLTRTATARWQLEICTLGWGRACGIYSSLQQSTAVLDFGAPSSFFTSPPREVGTMTRIHYRQDQTFLEPK